MPDGSDFMGGVFRFVGAVLNMLFSAETRNNTRMTIWTSDSVSTDAMMMTPQPVIDTATMPQPSGAQRAHDEVATLQQIDPDFNEIEFLSMATTQYNAYVAADGAMDADAIAAIATPSFVDSYRKQVADWRAAGLRRVVHDMTVSASAIIKVSVDGTRQAVIVRFSTSGVRFTQDVDSGVATDGSASSETFSDFVTFVRPPGTTTPKSAGTGGATHCPSCGAPTTAGAATCPYCGTQLTGTGGTWLLDHISASAYT
ncbi:MAG TPA: zinc-ribbon domain-containing transport protein [Candidatus Eremiobacteraceae bacterium]|nr:zinc-ribbon domain-containing transport protein [Candidatus Eremiobacteraceae bacterium]